MFTHLIKRILETAVERLLTLVTPQEVKGLAVERLVALGPSAAEGINYEDLVEGINYADLAAEVSYPDLASDLDYGEIEVDWGALASNLDYNDLAGALDYGDLAGEINYAALVRTLEYDDLAGVLDYDLLGERAAASLDYGRLAEALRRTGTVSGATPSVAPSAATPSEVTALSARLIDAAVERLLLLADESIRDGEL